MKLDKTDYAVVIWAVVAALFVSCGPARASDAKFCGVVVHDISTGKLHRDTAAVARYLKANPKPIGEEADWEVDHPYPLACGGCDNETNMILMHKSIKTCARTPGGPYCKDRYERRRDLFCSKPVTHVYVP